ncbi:MAG: hypothetical protein CO098_10805 [Bacteroidetes bacterium CG_4_9_14_3_um_filter_41_19]|nr:MAG: hypothetical protein CO098_10805 [Bacteroidetes bacterium CG_4_9_14_3_um_filter_41_19]
MGALQIDCTSKTCPPVYLPEVWRRIFIPRLSRAGLAETVSGNVAYRFSNLLFVDFHSVQVYNFLIW